MNEVTVWVCEYSKQKNSPKIAACIREDLGILEIKPSYSAYQEPFYMVLSFYMLMTYFVTAPSFMALTFHIGTSICQFICKDCVEYMQLPNMHPFVFFSFLTQFWINSKRIWLFATRILFPLRMMLGEIGNGIFSIPLYAVQKEHLVPFVTVSYFWVLSQC